MGARSSPGWAPPISSTAVARGARPTLDLFNPRALTPRRLFRSWLGSPSRHPHQDDLTLLACEGFSGWGRASFSRASGLAAEPRSMLAKGSAHNLAWEDLKAVNAPGAEKVKPRSNGGARLDEGRLEARLPGPSWNVIRLSHGPAGRASP
jgi:hypothetical protein